MQEFKYCEVCGKLIGDAYNTDWYAYIRMKYCKECAKKMKVESNRLNRKKKKEIKKSYSSNLDEHNNLLKRENELLDKKNKMLELEIEKLERKIENE